MDKHLFLICWSVILCFSAAAAVKITELRVPELVNIEHQDSVILDCDFDVGNDTEGLVLKWHFGEQLIYQWIFNHTPQALGIFKDKLDLNYTVNDEPYTMHRALKINNLSRDLSGDYKCTIFTWNDEDTVTDKMTIFDPPTSVDMLRIDSEDDEVQIVCSVYEMFPEPNVNISYLGSNSTENISDIITTKSHEGLYNTTMLISFKDDTFDSAITFTCKITIPDTNYLQQIQLIYYPGPATTTTELNVDYDSTTVIPETEDKSGVPVIAVSWISLLFVTLTTILLT